ncbi:MFS transporter [Lentzea sp. NPDC060358]|uniref:MFS transporter n=1 Tax=Lentzea sp. NPDC060358 TaxID=3347103 RepID=UPI003648101A
MRTLRKYAGPLSDRRFRLLWAGQGVSTAGDAAMLVALSLALVSSTGSASALGFVLAATAVPRLLLTLVGGVWADRLPRQKVMLAADAVNLVAQVGIGVELLGTVDVGLVAVYAAASGAAAAFFVPASGAIVPSTVAPEHLARANALVALTRQIAMVAGPALATALVVTIGAPWVFFLNAGTFAVSAVTLALLRVPAVAAVRTGFWDELRQGWREFSGRRWFWTNATAHICWNLGRSAYQVLGPLVAVRQLGGELSWGLIAQGAAIGAVGGAVVALHVRPRRPLVVANLALALGAVPLVLLAVAAAPVVIALAAGVMHAGLSVMQVIWQTTVQNHVPEHALSRVLAYDWLGSLALAPLGLALAGPLADRIGLPATLAGAAVLLAGGCLLVLAVPEVRRIGSRPHQDLPTAEE